MYPICMTNKYIPQLRSLKHALKHGIVLKEVQKVIQFNQKT